MKVFQFTLKPGNSLCLQSFSAVVFSLQQHPFRNAEGLVKHVSVKTLGTMPKCSSVEADSAGAQVSSVKALSIFMVMFYSVIKSRLAQAVIFQGVQKEPKGSLGLIQGLPRGWDARSSQKKVKQARL